MDIFTALPKAQASKGTVTPAQWARGGLENEHVAGQYDKFVDVTEYAFGGFLPWLLRAIKTLVPFSAVTVSQVDWDGLARRFETCRAVDATAIDQVVAVGSVE
jgi:hypothetical protein